MTPRKKTTRKAKTRKVVTVVPTINHDKMRRGSRYDLVFTEDVAARVNAGVLTIVDSRDEPVPDAIRGTNPTRTVTDEPGLVSSDTSPSDTLTSAAKAATEATEQEPDDDEQDRSTRRRND